jgi:hypothetical protein
VRSVVAGRVYYKPSEHGAEAEVAERLHDLVVGNVRHGNHSCPSPLTPENITPTPFVVRVS